MTRAWLIAFLSAASLAQAAVPREAEVWRSFLSREARAVWGMAAPVATFGAQVHQESRWRADASSSAGALGLAQFMPRTAEWMGEIYGELSEARPLDPRWALRALVRYDRYLWDRISARDSCERMAMTLASYNGGLGNLARERAAAAAAGDDPLRWFGSVAEHCRRSSWACAENRAYPRRILCTLQRWYAVWGPGVECEICAERESRDR